MENDNILCELKKLLILIYKSGYEDIRIGIKKHNKTIKDKDNNKEIKKEKNVYNYIYIYRNSIFDTIKCSIFFLIII